MQRNERIGIFLLSATIGIAGCKGGFHEPSILAMDRGVVGVYVSTKPDGMLTQKINVLNLLPPYEISELNKRPSIGSGTYLFASMRYHRPTLVSCGDDYLLLWVRDGKLKGRFLDDKFDVIGRSNLTVSDSISLAWRYDAALDKETNRIMVVWDERSGGNFSVMGRLMDCSSHSAIDGSPRELTESDDNYAPSIVSTGATDYPYAMSWSVLDPRPTGIHVGLLSADGLLNSAHKVADGFGQSAVAFDGTRLFVVFTDGRSDTTLKGSFVTIAESGVLEPRDPHDILTAVDGPSRLLLSYSPGRGDYAVAFQRKPDTPSVTQLFVAFVDKSSGTLVSQQPRDPSDRPDFAGGLDSNDKHWLFHEAEDGAESRIYLFESP